MQFAANPWPLFVFWPIGLISDFVTAKIVVYLLIAVLVFSSGYGLARLLYLPTSVALVAGWILTISTTPVVPYPFFCPLLALAPSSFLQIVSPVVVFWLMRMAGRSTVAVDAFVAAGLFALVLFFLAVVPAGVPLTAVGVVPYAAIVLLLVRRPSELLRKVAILFAIGTAGVLLRWPWYFMGLFSYMAPQVFPQDFSVPYVGAVQVSVLFQGQLFGWMGPVLVVMGLAGALLSVRHRCKVLRVAAYVLPAVVFALICVRVSFFLFGDWLVFPTIYLEMSVWPLYAVFCAVALQRTIGFATARLGVGKSLEGGRRAGLVIPFAAVLVALGLSIGRSTRDYAPFPPTVTPMANILRSEIGFMPGARFNGRVATIIPIDPDNPESPWQQQQHASLRVWRAIGNDQMATGFWYFHIPTLFEYNQFLSPTFHALVKRTLQRPALVHVRNIQIYTYADPRILALLGVRYVILPQESSTVGVRRAVQEIAGRHWGLFELPAPNLATYSPTVVEVRQSLSSTLDFVTDDSIDLTRIAAVTQEIAGPLTPADASSISNSGGDLHVVARSAGRSLLVVPVEFSHCLELHDRRRGLQGQDTRLVRVDGVLTGVLFERELDAVIAFRIGPLHNPDCRWKDYQELKTMLR
jgi:hypothetical protein